jgi:hypothetical protein
MRNMLTPALVAKLVNLHRAWRDMIGIMPANLAGRRIGDFA